MARELINVITIQQGANWKFNVSIFDDEIYKLKYVSFLDTYKDLIPANISSTLNLLITEDIEQVTMRAITDTLLVDILTPEMTDDLDELFQEVQNPDLTGKRVKIYFQIYRSVSSSKTMKFNYEGQILGSNVNFDIPASETQQMIHKLNRDYNEQLLGFYTIELQDIETQEVMRILEGDCIISRGAKDVCEVQASE